jgi:hypothetical protein
MQTQQKQLLSQPIALAGSVDLIVEFLGKH